MARRDLRSLTSFACVAALSVGLLHAQEPGAPAPTPEIRARFERFLVAEDDEAERLATELARESPATLAALSTPVFDGKRGARLVFVPGFDPPLACSVVTPQKPPPPSGYPVAVVMHGPFNGPEEFEMRARFGRLLEAGAALVSPVESTPWLKESRPITSATGSEARNLLPLLVAAARAAPLDASRRVMFLGGPVGSAHGAEVPRVGRAFAALHAAAAGDPTFMEFHEFADLGPRRIVLHYGPRIGDAIRIGIQDAVQRGRAAGQDMRPIEDPALEHASTARLREPAASAALKDLSRNRAPETVVLKHAPEEEGGAMAVVFGIAGPAASLTLRGLGTARFEVVLASMSASKTPLKLFVPRSAETPRDWTRPESWTGPSLPVPVAVGVGCTVVPLPPEPRTDALWAFRLERRSGVSIAAVARATVRP